MKYLLLICSCICLIYACNNKKEAKVTDEIKTDEVSVPKDTLLITDSSWGPITSSSNMESLKKTFGPANVKDETICGAECVDSIDVTIISPGTNRELTIYWQDSGYHKMISAIESADTASPYHTTSGLHVRSTLQDILKINGKKISFSGFGWDYGGNIGSYNNGALEKSNLGLQLDYVQDPADDGLFGDRELNTDMPLVKKNLDKIIITGLTLSFNR